MLAEQHDIGHGVKVMWDQDGRGIYWQHPECGGWLPMRFAPDPRSAGHLLMKGGPTTMNELTIAGQLKCSTCGKKGMVKIGRWIPA